MAATAAPPTSTTGHGFAPHAPCCDDAGMTALTLEEIAAKIATAESGFAAATSQYDRNMFAQIRDEYRNYAAERAKQIQKQAAGSAAS
jgi:hypothetical protein